MKKTEVFSVGSTVEAVSFAEEGEELISAGAELGAEVFDVDGKGVAGDDGFVVPQDRGDVVSGQEFAGVFEEQRQQFKFFPPEGNGFSVHKDLSAGKVHPDPFQFQDR